MFGHFFFWLLKAKFSVFTVFTAAKIPLIATLLVLGTTGFVVTGTIQGDEEGDRTVNLTIRPLETKACVDALIAQTEALLEVDMLAADANAQLRHMRDRARESADEQNKIIDEDALRTQVATSSDRILHELSAVTKQILDLHREDLKKCQDGDPDTSITLDVADLRDEYKTIVQDFGKKLNDILDEAQQAFDVLVENALPKPPKPPKQGSSSRSRD
jgi:hypothetical protein